MTSIPRTRAAAVALTAALALVACPSPKPEPGDPLEGLTDAERERFERGRASFDRVFRPETGLGPLFNSTACGTCHNDPGSGGGGGFTVVHATAFEDGFCNMLADSGGPVYQLSVTPALRDALGIDREPIPAHATGEGRRSTPDLFGFGLLDAVPDSAILALADPDDSDGDGISGRVNRFFDDRIGRFGRKALVPTLDEFNEGAFPVEQGVTAPNAADEGTVGGTPIPAGVDPLPEPEVDARAVAGVNDFVRFLAPPPGDDRSGLARRGERLFGEIGCADCHVPTLRTGAHAVEALSNREFAAYTDLLLHDMGPELADICFGLVATPSEFRTEPLIGLGLARRFLHDGRASTIEEAIRLHGGEATASRRTFEGLSPGDRAAVVEFLRSL